MRSGVISLPGRLAPENEKQGGKIRPNTFIISHTHLQVNAELVPDLENLCSAQKQMCAFGKHSILKS